MGVENTAPGGLGMPGVWEAERAETRGGDRGRAEVQLPLRGGSLRCFTGLPSLSSTLSAHASARLSTGCGNPPATLAGFPQLPGARWAIRVRCAEEGGPIRAMSISAVERPAPMFHSGYA